MRIREFGTLALPKEGLGGIHPFHEILFIETGSSDLMWMNKKFELSAPVLILIPANTPHWLTPLSPESSGWFIEVDMQDAPFLDNEIVSLWNQTQAKHGKKEWSPMIATAIQSVHILLQAFESRTISRDDTHQLLELDIRKFLLLIDHAMMNGADLPLSAVEDGQFPDMDRHIYMVLRHMERSYTEPITLEDLSQMCNFAPSYIIRLFKENIGSTPIQYLQKLRLNAAICYLEATELPIQQIAEITGFPDPHYFSRLFKRKNGVSPSQWREQFSTSVNKHTPIV